MDQFYSYILLVIGWLIFGLVHSLLATKKAKDLITLGDLGFRRFYNLISIIMLIALLIGGAFIQSSYFLPLNKANKAIGLIIATFGYLVFKLAFKQISLSAFLGLKPDKQQDLISSGIYARVRHPLYTASILLVIGFVIFSPSITNLIHAICIILYIFIGAYFEEKKLIDLYGQQYIDYKKSTPFIIPRFWTN